MERAARACVGWISSHLGKQFSYVVFCGPGNNGGDGLAIARLLHENGFDVQVYLLTNETGSPDFETNRKRFSGVATLHLVNDGFPHLENVVVVDAIFGSGLNRPAQGIYLQAIKYINRHAYKTVSIDMPSGMRANQTSRGNAVIQCDFLLTFQAYKLAFLLPENQPFIGEVYLLDIGLSAEFEQQESSEYRLIDSPMISQLYRRRKAFSHKGTYGSACLMAGSYGMMGAAVLSARACLRSGVGKLTCMVPEKGVEVMQISVPEAMTQVNGLEYLQNAGKTSAYDSVGIGPGIGRHAGHASLLKDIFRESRAPLVLDADALNAMAGNPEILQLLPAGSILTPHPKEFERLFGSSASDFERMQKAAECAREYKIHIVLKGHHTFITSGDTPGYFNSSGNPGMATAGAGDVLTGILTSLLAQKYKPLEACLLGVYLHGRAGDFAAAKHSQESMIAGDIVECLADAFLELSQAVEK